MILIKYMNLKLLILLVTSQTVFSSKTVNRNCDQNLDSVIRHINDLNKKFDDILILVNAFANTSGLLSRSQEAINFKIENVLSQVNDLKENSNVTKYEIGLFKQFYSDTDTMIEQVLEDISFQTENIENLLANNEGNLELKDISRTVSNNAKDESLIKDQKFGEGSVVKFETGNVCVQSLKNASPKSRASHRSLFHTADYFRSYYEAMKDCEIQGGTVFIPKTFGENEDWNNYARSLRRGPQFKEAFYPIIYYPGTSRFSWADCEENTDYYRIFIRKGQLNPGKIRRFASSNGAICIKRRNKNFFSDRCEGSRNGFAICQRI